MKAAFVLVAMAVTLVGASIASAGCTADTPTTSQTTPTSTTSTSTTSTTLPPGVMTFDTLLYRFERLVDHEDLAGTLPYSVMASEDVAWLSEAAAPVTVTEAQGYEFANGDVVILFFVEPVAEGQGAYGAASEALATAATDRYGMSDKGVWALVEGDFGYVVISRGHRSEFGRLAQWARIAYEALIPGEE
jgi:hypothetical protein